MQLMNYVEVLVGDITYHGNEALTYASESTLEEGQIVRVPIRQKQVLGITKQMVAKPKFPAKPIMTVPALPALPRELLILHDWMHEYYPAPLGTITQLFLPKALAKKPKLILPPTKIVPKKLPTLTNDQSAALEKINKPSLYLLHGETGTGKTRVYIELAQRALDQGSSVIILTPEIGLTPQLAKDFKKTFGDRVVLVHSGITDKNRATTWQYILEEETPLVVVGARSALFSPLKKIGLIVVDESHETSYKQDQAPYYHATMVAAKLAQLHKATIILGSATPSVADYSVARAKQRPIIRMSQIASNASSKERDVQVVDLRNKDNFTRSPYISNLLLNYMRQNLAKGEQTLLFLNRRGTARVVFCERCGWQALCRNCDLPLVYHGDSHTMRCHSCSYQAPSPSSCPSCHEVAIVFKSIGTKALTDEVRRIFPEARVARFDTDNKKNERIETHYESVHNGDVDILVGTQTLVKGLDLPKLSLVGIIVADASLYFPDFSAQERTYQLLRQVLGRIGRGHRDSHAVVQTYLPESTLIRAVIDKDWTNFYEQELAERKKYAFPPYCYLLKLTCHRATSNNARLAAELLAKKLRATIKGIVIEGPSPSFHEKSQNKYAWQVVVKSKRRRQLTEIIKALPSSWSYDIDPMNLL